MCVCVRIICACYSRSIWKFARATRYLPVQFSSSDQFYANLYQKPWGPPSPFAPEKAFIPATPFLDQKHKDFEIPVVLRFIRIPMRSVANVAGSSVGASNNEHVSPGLHSNARSQDLVASASFSEFAVDSFKIQLARNIDEFLRLPRHTFEVRLKTTLKQQHFNKKLGPARQVLLLSIYTTPSWNELRSSSDAILDVLKLDKASILPEDIFQEAVFLFSEVCRCVGEFRGQSRCLDFLIATGTVQTRWSIYAVVRFIFDISFRTTDVVGCITLPPFDAEAKKRLRMGLEYLEKVPTEASSSTCCRFQGLGSVERGIISWALTTMLIIVENFEQGVPAVHSLQFFVTTFKAVISFACGVPSELETVLRYIPFGELQIVMLCRVGCINLEYGNLLMLPPSSFFDDLDICVQIALLVVIKTLWATGQPMVTPKMLLCGSTALQSSVITTHFRQRKTMLTWCVVLARYVFPNGDSLLVDEHKNKLSFSAGSMHFATVFDEEFVRLGVTMAQRKRKAAKEKKEKIKKRVEAASSSVFASASAANQPSEPVLNSNDDDNDDNNLDADAVNELTEAFLKNTLNDEAARNEEFRALRYQIESLENRLVCSLCFDRQRNIVLPCGHFTMCTQCWAGIQANPKPTCPICRKPAKSSTVVFD